MAITRIFPVGLLCLMLFTPVVHALDVAQIQVRTDKHRIDLGDLRGQVVYVDFWASWCAPCRKSFPWLNQMQSQYAKQGLKVIAINVDENPKLARDFLQEHKAEFMIGYDSQGKLAQDFNVKGMPSSYLIDRTGKLRFAHVGFREKDIPKLEKQIRSVISE